MFSKSNIISTIVLAIWGYGGGYLLWGILGDSLLAEHVMTDGLMKEPLDMMHLILGCIIHAFAFSTIYGRFGAGNFGAASGLALGVWVAIMVGLGEGLIDFATGNILDLQGTFISFGIYLVFFAVTGLLAGLVYSKTSS